MDIHKRQAEDIGVFFAQLRYKKNLTQREVGKLFGGSQATITNFEKAQIDFKFSTLQRMARIFGYSVEITLVDDATGERVLVKSDPKLQAQRTYGGNTFTLSAPRGTSAPKPKAERKLKVVKDAGPVVADAKTEANSLRAMFGI